MQLLSRLQKRRGLDTTQLAAEYSKGYARALLAELERVGVACRTPDGKWRASGSWVPVNGYVSAVELKLRKWREALLQACAYREFANESWVVLSDVGNQPQPPKHTPRGGLGC